MSGLSFYAAVKFLGNIATKFVSQVRDKSQGKSENFFKIFGGNPISYHVASIIYSYSHSIFVQHI